MPYSEFTTITKVEEAFGLTTVEGRRFLPEIELIKASDQLVGYLEEVLPIAIATGSEKVRSELIIAPILLEVWRILEKQIGIFSGEDFDVDSSVGLNGRCDFLLSRSPKLIEIDAPAVVIVEAKKADLKSGIGQCVAEMVAAQRFNKAKKKPVNTIYGSVTSGTQWRFMKLEENTVTFDLSEYPVPPVDFILSCLIWMIRNA
ncbi:hypothetical protein G7B40_033955 [Aetokthonos hydrillicola Thurmond2011]|jgi:hypothetical protein|uniref:Type I restriction enzyme R protein N-terminal domain-containing protein n=2 Tax=Aetokthonos TaxID=1550243 RepID=A0AAP5IE28_9CYAN|nr:hypothetical protein [Aetokthonos hydrillicola]MBO3459756.1 hypothetical protein [Aetokthonos hydrillicola CCALA 1050]MBW4585189.1 hypothetical protein [Aetokthonos hydrillicola CCALA 1050]MDR9899527.1 hypothetical protein [Aetokthonos hydrillicola Thurmond2011]